MCKLLIKVRFERKLEPSLRPFFNGTLHVTFTQVNQNDFWLLIVGNQIDNLITNPFFSHNICFKYPNESCEPHLDIYVSKAFQWYKIFLRRMSFDLYNYPLKIQKSIGTPTSKMEVHLEMCGFMFSHSLTFLGAGNVIPGFYS